MADQHGDRRLGWLGTGRMGAELVRRLLAAGCDVSVYNRTQAKAQPLAALGAKVVDSAADLASCDIVFVMVGTSEDLIDAVLGPGGLMSDTAMPSILVDCSTISAEASAQVRAAGRRPRHRAARRAGHGQPAGGQGGPADPGRVRAARGVRRRASRT